MNIYVIFIPMWKIHTAGENVLIIQPKAWKIERNSMKLTALRSQDEVEEEAEAEAKEKAEVETMEVAQHFMLKDTPQKKMWISSRTIRP